MVNDDDDDGNEAIDERKREGGMRRTTARARKHVHINMAHATSPGIVDLASAHKSVSPEQRKTSFTQDVPV